VVAGAGVPVAKHGNRSVSSHCGSADVLEALGVNLAMSADDIGKAVRQEGIGFMFAPMLHGAMKHAIGPRKEIGIRTIFNILGPLTNPAQANVYLLGVFSPDLVETLAHVLGRFGVKRALVVCGEGNIDEITITGPTLVADYQDGKVSTYSISPENVGLSRASLEDIKGGETAELAAIQVREILGGKPGPCLDTVLLNAGAALMAAGKADDLKGGVELARQSVESGAALAKLNGLVAFSAQGAA
jgi:anthranilate phosphoribosyltransferase